MKKVKIDVDIVLPDVPDEKDACVHRIIHAIEAKRGIEKVHIVPETETSKAKLCFHYNPVEISIDEVQKLAEKSGAEITEQYGHLLLEVRGVRYVRHARILELGLRDTKGILSVSVSATGWINIEFDHHEITPEKIYKKLNKMGLDVISPALETILTHRHVHIENEDMKVESEEPVEHGHEEHGHDHKEDKHNHQGHQHEHKTHDHAHGHVHGGIFGEKTELIFAIICGALLGIGFGLSFVKDISPYIPIAFYAGAYLFGGFLYDERSY